MRNVSEKLKEKIYNGTAKFYQEAHIVFPSGKEKDLGMRDFYLSGNGFSDGAGTNALALGEAMAKSINVILVNDEDQLSEHDFYQSRITIWCCCDVDGTVERMKIGTFTIDIPTAREGEIEITGTDDMHKGDIDYNTSISFPATAKQILLDSCRTCGVTLKKESFTNDNFIVTKKPTQCTHRAVWGMVAMLAGGNARMDENNLLEIISYDLSFFGRKGLDGGRFDNGEPLYQTGDTADGGNFLDYSSGDTYDGGDFEELSRYHMFYKSQTPTIDTDDVVITGVQASSGDSYGMYGKEGYVLTLENQLIAGKVQEGVNTIGALIVGMRFRPFTVDHTAYPLAEFGDICYVFDRKGNYYQSVVTDINFSFYGYTTIKCSADSVMRNQSEFKPAAAGIVADVEKQTEEKFENVSQDIDNVNNGIDGINQDIDGINQDIDGINEDIGEVNEKVGNLNISLKKTNEGLQAEVSRAISAEETIGSRVSITENNIDLEVRRAKGAEETLSGRINITESNISLEVQRAKGAESSLSSRINMTESSIDLEVQRAQSAESNLSSRISITESNINLKVSKGEIISAINLSPEAVDIDASKINLNGAITANGNFRVNLDGTVESNSGVFTNAVFYNGIYFRISGYGDYPVLTVPRYGELYVANSATHTHVEGSLGVVGAVHLPGAQSMTTSADANVVFSGGYLYRSTGSLAKWKNNVSEIKDPSIDAHMLYNVKPRQFIYKDDYLPITDKRSGKFIPGFIVDELIEDYPISVEYNENGEPENWGTKFFIAPMLQLIQEHKTKLNEHDDLIHKIIEKIGGI